jgi:hypothetical protein
MDSMTQETDLIRALAEDLALEILASYTSAEDFEGADFSSLGRAAVYLEEHADGPGPALQELIAKVQSAAGSNAEGAPTAPEPPPIVGEP